MCNCDAKKVFVKFSWTFQIIFFIDIEFYIHEWAEKEEKNDELMLKKCQNKICAVLLSAIIQPTNDKTMDFAFILRFTEFPTLFPIGIQWKKKHHQKKSGFLFFNCVYILII